VTKLDELHGLVNTETVLKLLPLMLEMDTFSPNWLRSMSTERGLWGELEAKDVRWRCYRILSHLTKLGLVTKDPVVRGYYRPDPEGIRAEINAHDPKRKEVRQDILEMIGRGLTQDDEGLRVALLGALAKVEGQPNEGSDDRTPGVKPRVSNGLAGLL